MIHRDDELQALETELRQLRPRPLPSQFRDQLLEEALPKASPVRPCLAGRSSVIWLRWRRLLFPFAAGGLAILVLWAWPVRPPAAHPETGVGQKPKPTAPAPVPADQVEFDSQLLASFDTVAELPGGVPVRFECRQYEDRVIFHHGNSDLTVERSAPRLEIVPVRFETY